MRATRFLQLSKPTQTLIRLCQRINYGSLSNVSVVDGEVQLDRNGEVNFDVKLDTDVAQREELDLHDFALPVETCRLLTHIDALRNGVIEKIVVHDGLPRRVVLRGTIQEVRL